MQSQFTCIDSYCFSKNVFSSSRLGRIEWCWQSSDKSKGKQTKKEGYYSIYRIFIPFFFVPALWLMRIIPQRTSAFGKHFFVAPFVSIVTRGTRKPHVVKNLKMKWAIPDVSNVWSISFRDERNSRLFLFILLPMRPKFGELSLQNAKKRNNFLQENFWNYLAKFF